MPFDQVNAARKEAAAERYDKLRPRVLELYAKHIGAKAIAKLLGVSPRITLELLRGSGVYEPGKLQHLNWRVNEKGQRFVGNISHVKKSIQQELVERKKKSHRRTADLPLFAYASRIHRNSRAAKRFLAQYKSSIEFRLIHLLRKRLNKVARRGRGYSGNNLVWLGCTPEELRAHLESQFQTGMRWANLGTGVGRWQIDHKRPCASFDMTKESDRLACFHFTNLQPLWALENACKGATWNGRSF